MIEFIHENAGYILLGFSMFVGLLTMAAALMAGISDARIERMFTERDRKNHHEHKHKEFLPAREGRHRENEKEH